MTNSKTTKRALFSSVISLLLCCAMLIGTTFAWFTDSVTSKNNIIKSGNLDVKLEYATVTEEGEKSNWTEVTNETVIFDENALWEPGYTEVIYLRVSNVGSLALKYQLGVNIISEEEGINVNGDSFKLSDYIKFGVVENDNTFATRDLAREAVDTGAKLISEGYSKSSSLLPQGEDNKSEEYVTLVVYMPEDVGNEANHKTGTEAPKIDLGINLFATQYTSESDSFGTDYDKGAAWAGGVDTDWYFANPDATEFTITSAEELAGFAAIVNGTAIAPATTYVARSSTTVHDTFADKTVKLGGNIDLNDITWTPIGRIGTTSTDFTYAFKGTFDGQNYTISNLDVDTHGWAGVFGVAYKAMIKNLSVVGVTINSNRMAGSIVGQLYGSIDNCHVSHANITVIPNAVGDSYDNGDKVGGIVGWIGDNNNNRTLTNCSATDVELRAYRDIGGIAGYAAYSTTISNNSVKGVTIIVDQITNYYGDKDFCAGEIWGRNSVSSSGVGVTAENNKKENSSIAISYMKDGIQYAKDGVTDEVTLHKIPADYTDTTVYVAEGTTTIGGYAFANNSNIEKIVLPSSVTTLNDRAFRDTSASTVVLNVGLTNISYQAFCNASNVTEVVIPSTVTTISKEAFQNSGITTLTIPANVTTIEYGGLRDMKMLETVVIEGNVDIPVYAFRACTNLRTVIMTGDNVTFGGGSRGMIFTNKENGDGSAITVYVANETVRDRLLEADTAAKDYDGYKIVVGVKMPEADNLLGSLTDGADTIYLPAGNYTFPASTKLSKDDVIICAEGTVFQGVSHMDINGATVIGATFDAAGNTNDDTGAGTQTINGTFKNCTFTGNHALRYCYAGENVVFENCVFDADKRGIHFDGTNNDVYFKNCVINGFNAIGNGTGTVTFEGCTFGASNHSYNGMNVYNNITMIDCTFNFISGKTNFIDLEGTGKTLIIRNCTATFDGNPVSIASYIGGGKIAQNTVIIDDTTRVSDGLFTDANGNYYVYNATGLQALKTWMDENSNKGVVWGKTYNIMADIDASTVTWNTKFMVPDSATFDGFTFNGNGHTISNLTINGQGLFTGTARGSQSEVPATFKDITFDNVTVTGGSHHNGVVWGEVYGSITLEKVNVINSKVSGGCNVGGLVGRNSESNATIKFVDCSVKNTKVEATTVADYAGASAFLGMALHIDNNTSANVIFDGTNVAEGNTLTTAEGMQGGGIYTYATWGKDTWEKPTVVDSFTNYNSAK